MKQKLIIILLLTTMITNVTYLTCMVLRYEKGEDSEGIEAGWVELPREGQNSKDQKQDNRDKNNRNNDDKSNIVEKRWIIVLME